jgi:3-oxoacyl-[acyl-carrier-protein] synthase II
MMSTAVGPLVITGCGVVSPAGTGLDALADATSGARRMRSHQAGHAVHGEFPPVSLAATPDLQVTEQLGRKGVRSLDRTTQLALMACSHALTGLSTVLTDHDRARTGVVMGTSTGSIRSSSEFTRETLVREKPYLVRANLFPNSVMNCCASQIAIWNSVRGVNATIAGGRLSSLAAVRYARNAITQGHIDRALVGGVEELCPQSAWAWYLSGALALGMAVGEGCAVFVVETPAAAAAAGRTPMAEILGCETATPGAVVSRRGLIAGLAACTERALRRSGVRPADVGTVSLSAAGPAGMARTEEDGVRAALGGLPGRQLRPAKLLGETFSASGALQMATLLAVWRNAGGTGEGHGSGTGEVALVTSVGQDGNVGCLVMRKRGALRADRR